MKVYKMKNLSNSEYNEGVLRNRLNDHESSPPPDMWSRIEEGMDARKRRFGWMFFGMASMLVIGLVSWVMLQPTKNTASLNQIEVKNHLDKTAPIVEKNTLEKSESSSLIQSELVESKKLVASSQNFVENSKISFGLASRKSPSNRRKDENIQANNTMTNNSDNGNINTNLTIDNNSLLADKSEMGISTNDIVGNNNIDEDQPKTEADLTSNQEVEKAEEKKAEDVSKPEEKKYRANRTAHPWAFGVSVKPGVSSHFNSGESSLPHDKEYYNNIETAKASLGLECYGKFLYKNGLSLQGGLAFNNIGFGSDEKNKSSNSTIDYIFVGILGQKVRHLSQYTGYNFNLLSLPLKVGYDFSVSRYNVFVKGGFTPSYSGNVRINHHQIDYNPSEQRLTKLNHFSASLGFESGINLKMARNVYLGIGYSGDYYLSSITKENIKTRFLTNRLYTGLQFKL